MKPIPLGRVLSFFTLLLTAVAVNAQPVANFTVTPTLPSCPPAAIFTFTNTSTGGATTYTWNFGDGSPGLTNPTPPISWSYSATGTYTVTLQATNSSGTTTKTATVTVHPRPTVSFTASPLTVCSGSPVQFTSTSNPGGPGPNTYQWSFGDGSPFSTGQNPSHIYNQAGGKKITLTVTNAYQCTKTEFIDNYVTVNSQPTVTINANNTFFCEGSTATVNFTSNPTGNGPFSYAWDFGDGNTSGLANPTHTYTGSAPINYSVSLVVTDANGCKATVSNPNYITIQKINANFTAPASACVGTPVTFTNTSTPNFSSSNWKYGSLGGGTSSPDIFTFTTPGTHIVRLIANNGLCKDTIEKNITIHPLPTVNFTLSPPNPCPAPVTVQFIPTGGTSYVWDFGDNTGTSTTSSPTHTYTGNGFYTPGVIATDANGCKNTLIKTDFVKIYDGDLTVTTDTLGGCIPLPVKFGYKLTTSVPTLANPPASYPFSITSWSWDFGDGNTSSSSNPTHTYTNVGVFKIKLTVVTANGCSFTDSTVIKTGVPPVASFTAAPTSLCGGREVFFTNQTTGATDYVWDFGYGTGSTAVNPVYQYDSAGTFTVTLKATYNFCEDTYKVNNLIHVNPSTSKFIHDYECVNRMRVTFKNKSFGATSYIWDFGDGNTTSTDYHPIHTYSSAGTYIVKLITFNSTYNCSDTSEATIVLFNPTLNFTASKTSICKGEAVQFTGAMGNGGNGSDYFWYVDGSFQPNAGSPSFNYTFNTTGYHTISLSAKDQYNCTFSTTKTNYILVAKPTVDFTANPLTGCIPLNVAFTDNSTPTTGTSLSSRTWSFGNGTQTLPGSTTNRTYPVKGAYDIKLIVTDNLGCKDSLTKVSYVQAFKPVADFSVSPDANGCIGEQLTFQNNSSSPAGATTALWSFGDGASGSSPHAYSDTGTYYVTLIATDVYGCKDTLKKPAYINISKPTASFTMSGSVSACAALGVVFTNTSLGAVNYAWNFGNGNTSTQKDPNEMFGKGNFKVTMVATNTEGCTDTATDYVDVLGYAGAFDYTPLLGCVPLEVSFTPKISNVSSLTWNFRDGSIVPAANPGDPIKHTYTVRGTYLPQIILSAGGCTDTSNGLDPIKVDGVDGGFIHGPACEGYEVTFEDTSNSLFSNTTSWLWTFDNGTMSAGKKPTKYYTKTGTYPVQLIVTNSNGCKDTVIREITINPLPVIDAGADTLICVSDAVKLQGIGGVSYVWSPAATLSCSNCPDPIATPLVKTEYIVIGTDANLCSDTDKVVVTTKTKTDSEVGDGGEICDDEKFKLTASGAHRYEWTPGESLDNATSDTAIAMPHSTTNYMVIAREGSCIPDTHFVRVVVHPKPTVAATGAATIISGNETPIQADGTLITKFLWTPGESLSCIGCSSPMAKPFRTTTYTVTASTDFGCSDSAHVTITVLCDGSQLFVPNTFTPNGDGENDLFYPRGNGMDKIKSFRVYNRWGEIVFERSSMKLNERISGWDGTFKNNPVPPDVFVYVVEANCDNGEVLVIKGDVTLVR